MIVLSYERPKRLIDIVASALALIFVAPLLAVLTLAVRFKLGKPVLFRQLRPGLHAKPFELIKFRTMTDKRTPTGELAPDEERLTRFGAWLRSTSLDELPELVNVLKGEMSLVGPRPLLVAYLNKYSSQQARRHEVRPGLTGWAQVNGRNALDWPERLALDVWYVDHRSFLLDVRILVRTMLGVVRKTGINAPDNLPMPEFTGRTP